MTQSPLDFGGEHLDNPVAFEEILGLSVRLLPQMPLATTLVLQAAGFDKPVVFTTSEKVREVVRWRRWPVFGPEEMLALVEGVENDRAFPVDFDRWLERKQKEPDWRVTRKEIMGGVVNPDPPKDWSFDRLFRFLGLSLVAVRVEVGGG